MLAMVLHVLDQDPPGHTVYGQVMQDDQDPAGLHRTEVEEHDPDQRALLDVQA